MKIFLNVLVARVVICDESPPKVTYSRDFNLESGTSSSRELQQSACAFPPKIINIPYR